MAKVSKKSKRRLIIFGPLSLIAIAYFVITFVTYVFGYTKLKLEETKLNQNLIELKDKKNNLKIEITKLNNPEYVARYAKENYLYSSNGEYVIKIDSKDKTPEYTKIDNNKYIYIGFGVTFLIFIVLFIKKSLPKGKL